MINNKMIIEEGRNVIFQIPLGVTSWDITWELEDFSVDALDVEYRDRAISRKTCEGVEAYHHPKRLIERKIKVNRIVEYWYHEDHLGTIYIGIIYNPDLQKLLVIHYDAIPFDWDLITPITINLAVEAVVMMYKYLITACAYTTGIALCFFYSRGVNAKQ